MRRMEGEERERLMRDNMSISALCVRAHVPIMGRCACDRESVCARVLA